MTVASHGISKGSKECFRHALYCDGTELISFAQNVEGSVCLVSQDVQTLVPNVKRHITQYHLLW